jgi:hypothetical protein
MIFVQYNNENIVTFIHTKPFDDNEGLGKTKEELEKEGLFVDSLPSPDTTDSSKTPILKVNPIDNTLYYEYVDRPLTPEEKLQLLEQENQELKNRIEIMQQALDDLILGGM